jgi:Lipid A 3-O-deacylase (PagL)
MRAHYGFLWPHRPSSWILVEGHAPAIEIFAERKVSGNRQWHRAYRMPSYGLGVLYTGMANPERIGAGVRVLPYLFLPIASHNDARFGIRLGWGVGYIAEPFDRAENSKQIAIGSRLNTAIQIMPEYRIAIGRTNLHAGVGIDHWSNGSFKLPNLGLNYVSANLAVSRSFGTPEFQCGTWAPDTVRSREWSIVASAFASETARPLTGQYTVFSISGQRQWQITPKSHVMAGADVFNKGTLATVHPEMKEKDRLEYTQLGVHGGYALGFGKGEIFMHMGAYVYTPVPDEAAVFHRIGMRYRTGKHLLWNIALKSHYAVADHWEFGVGYRWN